MKRRDFVLSSTAAALLAGCSSNDDPAPAPGPRNAYRQVNLVASDAHTSEFNPALGSVKQDAEFLNAWGIAIRPAGAGGHFWVTAGGYSYQFVGDVTASADANLRLLFQDALAIVKLPGAGVPAGEADAANPDKFIGFATGTAFNGAPLASDHFVVRGQTVVVDGATLTLEGSARFLFATDTGVISGWTERNPADGSLVRRDGPAVAVVDGSAQGMAFFGLAVKTGTWDRLWAADFGAEPQIRAWDKTFAPIDLAATGAFANPFIGGKNKPIPGDYVPFNIQVLTVKGVDYAFVAYAKSQPDPNDATRFYAGEEDAIAKDQETLEPDRGRAAMFDLDGKLMKTFNDAKKLNAPWGVAVAPADFGALSGALLVGNFGGHGRIAAFNLDSGNFIDYLKKPDGALVEIEGLWGLQFGNGASLGDTNALYFAAGPGDETKGLFGALRVAV
jgi:uncharacterized protein (TIGR03118 family)